MAFNFVSYMQNLATLLKEVQHSDTDKRFFRMSGIETLEEVFNNVLTGQSPSIGVIENSDGRINDNRADKVDDRQVYTFMVMGRAPFMDHDARHATKNELKEIAFKLISRLKRDHETDYNLETDFGLRQLIISSFSYAFLPPVIDNIICLRVSFVVEEYAQINFDQAHWLPDPVETP